MNYLIMNLIALSVSVLCTLSLLYIVLKIKKPKYPTFIVAIIFGLLLGVFRWYSAYFYNEIVAYLMFFVFMVFLLKLLIHLTFNQAVFASMFSSIHFICAKGMVVGILALLTKKNLYQIITNSNYFLTALTGTMLLQIGVFLLYNKFWNRKKLESLLNSDKQLEDVLLQQSSLFLFMLFYSYNYYYNLDLVWFSFAQIILSSLIYVLYFLILNYGMKISYHIEKELHTEMLTQQLKIELAQHNAYQQTFAEIETFKHQFREKILSLDFFIQEGNIEKLNLYAREELPRLLEKLPVKKEFSNNEVVNAVLLDLDRQCITKQVPFHSRVYISDIFIHRESEILTLLHETKELFQFLTLPVINGELDINGKNVNNRFIIQATGSYRGKILELSDFPYFETSNSIKTKSAYHRLNDSVKSMGGTIFWDANIATCKFTITVSIHS